MRDTAIRIVAIVVVAGILGHDALTHAMPDAFVESIARQVKVDPAVLRETADGSAEFLVVLDDVADLRPALKVGTKGERGRIVFDALREVAARTQAPLIASLEERGVAYRSFWIANMVLVRGDRATVDALSGRRDVRRIEANPRVRGSAPPLYPGAGVSPLTASVEWNVSQILADRVWDLGYTGAGVVIGGQDTGYDWDHPALIDQYRGWNGATADHDHNWHDAVHVAGSVCGADSPEPCDDHNHGTHTMGIMVGDDGDVNRIGISPGATWIGCRNMDRGIGSPSTYAECFQWFVAPTDGNGGNPDPDLAPDVINNSWECPPIEGCNPDTLRTIVENTRAAGIVVVGGAGNSGSSCGSVAYPPAIYDAQLSVGATDRSDIIAPFSSRGPVAADGSHRVKPDLTAPGVEIRSSIRNGQYAVLQGTSMAAPHVVGVVALMIEARPDLAGRVEWIETILKRSARPLESGETCGGLSGTQHPNHTYGYGRVDALEAIVGDADDDGRGNLTDCNPVEAGIYQDAPDICDGIDNDCDRELDEARCADFDHNADGRVDGIELSILGRAFGSCSAAPSNEWWSAVDFTRDGCVDGRDLAILGSVWSCVDSMPLCP